MNRHFGEPDMLNPALIGEEIPTPVGDTCSWCQEEFIYGDAGLAIPVDAYFHQECFLRQIVGSVGHIRKQCSCFGGNLEDPPELSIREAAKAAVREYEEVEGRRR